MKKAQIPDIEISREEQNIINLSKRFLSSDLRDSFLEFMKSSPDAIMQAQDNLKALEDAGMPKKIDNRYNNERNDVIRHENEQLGSYGGAIAFNRYVLDNNRQMIGTPKYDIPINILELIKKDPLVGLGMAIIKYPIVAANWRIECDDESIAKTVEHVLRPVWNQLINDILLSLDYGFSGFEKIFAIEKNAVVKRKNKSDKTETIFYKGDLIKFKNIKCMHPSTLSVLVNYDEDFDGIRQMNPNRADGKNVDLIIDIPLAKSAWFTNEFEFGNYYGYSRLNRIYNFWYWKNLLYLWMLQYFERRGLPPIKGTAPAGKTRKDGQDYDNLSVMSTIIKNIVNNAAVTLPYEESDNGNQMWDVSYIQDEKRGDIFIEAIVHIGNAIIRGLLVPQRPEAVENSSGSGSAKSGKKKGDIFMLTEEKLVKQIEDWVDKNIIKDIVDYNFPKKQRVPARLIIDNLDESKRAIFKDLFMQVLRNVDALAKIGIYPKYVPSISKMAEFLELPIDETDDAYDFVPISEQGDVEDDPLNKNEDDDFEDEDIEKGKVKKAATKDELNQTKKIRQNAQINRRKAGPKKKAINQVIEKD